ncbi:MAG: hypothetical protein KAI95_18855, partial [Bacteroidales bacterium]|nr:hypothetical protein [Bacteroidales bacterium]
MGNRISKKSTQERWHQVLLSVLSILMLLPGCDRPVPGRDISIPSSNELQKLALKETRLTVHPGIPGRVPFWNTHAERFIYAPAFDFPETESADNYRFTILREGGPDTLSFIADKPWAPLSPVWDKIETGPIRLMVEALNDGNVIGRAGEIEFYRASPYRGPYHAKRRDYSESAEKLFRYLYQAPYIQYWEKHGRPDPDYGL